MALGHGLGVQLTLPREDGQGAQVEVFFRCGRVHYRFVWGANGPDGTVPGPITEDEATDVFGRVRKRRPGSGEGKRRSRKKTRAERDAEAPWAAAAAAEPKGFSATMADLSSIMSGLDKIQMPGGGLRARRRR
jgi:hypothetical protein